MGISECHATMAGVDPFRPGRLIILRGRRRRQARQSLAVVPGHPLRWILLQFLRMPQQLREIVECIDVVELALSKALRRTASLATSVYRDTEAEGFQSFDTLQHASAYCLWRQLTTGVGVGFALMQQFPNHNQ